MKTLLSITLAFLMFSCMEEITPTPIDGYPDVLRIESTQYTEVMISGFGSVWVNGNEPVMISLKKGKITYTACGIDGEIIHDGKTKLYIECP